MGANFEKNENIFETRAHENLKKSFKIITVLTMMMNNTTIHMSAREGMNILLIWLQRRSNTTV